MKEGKFGPKEAVWLTTITISTKAFFTSPATAANLVGNTAWYMTLISALTALVGFLFIFKLLQKFPGKDLPKIFESTFGKLIGSFFSLALAGYLMFTAITRLAEFTAVTRTYVLPLSPNWYIIVFFTAAIYVLSRLGLETLARSAKFFIYPMLIGYIFVLFIAKQVYRINNIFPLLGNGLATTVQTGIVRSSVYGEVVILAVFASSLQGVQHIKKEGILSIFFSALIISSSVFFYNLTFPYFVAKELTAPMYELAALVNYNRFVQRVEDIFLFIWIISAIISTTTVFYAAIHIFCQIFQIQDKNPIVLAGCVLLLASVLLHGDVVKVILGNVETIRKLGSLFFFVLPFTALITAAISNKGEGKNA